MRMIQTTICSLETLTHMNTTWVYDCGWRGSEVTFDSSLDSKKKVVYNLQMSPAAAMSLRYNYSVYLSRQGCRVNHANSAMVRDDSPLATGAIHSIRTVSPIDVYLYIPFQNFLIRPWTSANTIKPRRKVLIIETRGETNRMAAEVSLCLRTCQYDVFPFSLSDLA